MISGWSVIIAFLVAFPPIVIFYAILNIVLAEIICEGNSTRYSCDFLLVFYSGLHGRDRQPNGWTWSRPYS